MEWLKIITQFIGSLIWPTIVLTLALLFRKEIRNRLGAIKELKYPGGSVTLEVEVERLEKKVERTGTKIEESATTAMCNVQWGPMCNGVRSTGLYS